MDKEQQFVNMGQLAVGAKALACAVGGMIAGWDMSLKIFGWLLFIDYLTGSLNALFIHKKWTSDVGGKGIAKKLHHVLLVAACHLVDKLTILPAGPIQLGNIEVNGLGAVAAIWFSFNEFGSILENAKAAGVVIPGPIQRAIDKLKELMA